jgi:ABC-type Fe3+-hydroxamate transport system substrate-binding protein
MEAFSLQVPVTQPPQRVVSLVPSVTESLFDLGLGSRLIAVTDYCKYPEAGVAALPRVGGTKNPDVERIITLQPDLVIANVEENRKADVEALQAAGIPVWVTFPRTVAEAINLLWDMMRVFDEASMVPRVRLIEQTMDWVVGLSKSREDNPTRVFAPIWLDPLMTFNADTYIHDLLRVCGGLNVFADRQRQYPLKADMGKTDPLPPERTEGLDTRYPRITLDEVVAAQPDVILLPSEPFEFTEAHIPMFAALDVPAAHQKRIHLVDGALLTWHGTRLAYALNTFPALLME